VIAIDTSSFIAYLAGAAGADVETTALALEHRQAVLPPVVLSELLSESASAARGREPVRQAPDAGSHPRLSGARWASAGENAGPRPKSSARRRLCFRWEGGDAHDVEIVDYH
jgi:predicted nucleic acid-binding protein